MSALLSVENLHVGFGRDPKANEVVKGVSFALDAGKTLAIVGESGSGKSVTALSINRLVDYGGGRDLIHSVPDVMASTANFLKSYGWRRGQPWSPGNANFSVIQAWNKSRVYSRTIAYFADRLAQETGWRTGG